MYRLHTRLELKIHFLTIGYCLGLALVLAIPSLSAFSVWAAEEGKAFRSENIAQLSREQLTLKVETVRGVLASVSEGEINEQNQQSKVTLQRQISLLEEYISQKDTLIQLSSSSTDNKVALQKARSQLNQLMKLEPVNKATVSAELKSATLSSAELTLVENQLNHAREKKSSLVNQQLQQQSLESELPGYLQSTNSRYRDAEQRESMLIKSRASEQSLAALAIVDKQIENAQLDKLIARQAEAVFEARRQWFRNSEPLLQLELELTENQIDRLEQKLAIYHQIMQEQLESRAKLAEQELQAKERTVEQAIDPDARFLAEWAATIARSQKNISAYQAMNISLTKEVTEQRKWLALESDEFASIINLLSGRDNYDAAERIRRSLQQLRVRRDLLQKLLRDEKFIRLSEYRERSFEITDILYSLNDEFDRQKQQVLAQLDEAGKREFQSASQTLLSDYRNILRDEKAALTEVISNGQKLALATEQRLNKLDEFERLVQSTSFWIKDSKPLNLQSLFAIPNELYKDLNWLRQFTSVQNFQRLSNQVKTAETVIYLITLFILLPMALTLLRRYLRGISIRINDRVQNEGKLVYLAMFVLVTGLLSAALLPAYFFVVARIAELSRLPGDISLITSEVCDHLALFFLLWFLSRSFFAGRSITEVQFDLPRAAANSLYSGFRWFMLGYLLLLPATILRNVPFNNQIVPQLFSIIFLFMTAISVYRLTRPKCEFVQHQLIALNVERITSGWGLISRSFLLVVGSAIVLSGMGYQFASQTIIYRLWETLLLFALLPAIYRLLRGSMLHFVEQRMRRSVVIDNSVTTKSEHKSHAVRLLKVASIVLGILLLLRIWGIDEQALITLDEIQLYKVQITGSEPEFVTLGSYLRCLLAIFVVYWAMRSLPNFMGLWIFPYWNTDVGVKYAVTTMSRYVLFLIGVIYIVSELHLDLAKLGWLMAAIGVGLGFGLQEIVSNFVSGLILLAERPVKPGDVVTIGSLSGTVSNINIRATTIVNFDRQEVMVPNRNLITNEVINWTRSDTINRVVVTIGVAYGSDLDKVTALLMNIANEQPKVLMVPAPSVFFIQHGESSLDLELRVFVSSPDNILPVRDQINRQISKVFQQEQIEIPFPQRDVHIRSSDFNAAVTKTAMMNSE